MYSVHNFTLCSEMFFHKTNFTFCEKFWVIFWKSTLWQLTLRSRNLHDAVSHKVNDALREITITTNKVSRIMSAGLSRPIGIVFRIDKDCRPGQHASFIFPKLFSLIQSFSTKPPLLWTASCVGCTCLYWTWVTHRRCCHFDRLCAAMSKRWSVAFSCIVSRKRWGRGGDGASLGLDSWSAEVNDSCCSCF